jgi:sugar/nucleoside kinase (ribokinase family)
MAESAYRLLSGDTSFADTVRLISPIGQDMLGQYVRSTLTESGLRTDGLIASNGATSSVTLQLNHSGDLITGIADIDADGMSPEHAASVTSINPSVVAFDANISSEAIRVLLQQSRCITIFEPTSVVKCTKIVDLESFPDIMTPNEAELLAMYEHAVPKDLLKTHPPSKEEALTSGKLRISPEVVRAALAMCKWKNVVLLIKCGERGVLLARPSEDEVKLQQFSVPVIKAESIVNTTGCGDTFAGVVAACIHVQLQDGSLEAGKRPFQWSEEDWSSIIETAQRAAALTLQSANATSNKLHKLAIEMDLFAGSKA